MRRAFLCGVDTRTGRDYGPRRQWIADRIKNIAGIFANPGIFAIGAYGHAVMSNHDHPVVRVNPDIAARWSNEEIANRWVESFPRGDDTADQLHREGLLADPARLAMLRQRLGPLSWFMRGRFLEARFKCQVLLDDHAVLAAVVYVDLNPLRAGIAAGFEDSDYTSAQACFRILNANRDAWEAVAETVGASMRGHAEPLRPLVGPTGGEALCESVIQSMALVDWTGRQWREGKESIDVSRPSALACPSSPQCSLWARKVPFRIVLWRKCPRAHGFRPTKR